MLKIYLILMLFSSFLGTDTDADNLNQTPPRKEVVALTKDAVALLKNADYERSFLTSRLALHYSINLKDNNLIAKSYNLIGRNYGEVAEFDKAIFNYKKGLLYAHKAKNDTIASSIYNNLGNIYCFEKNDAKKGISYLEKTLLFDQKNKDTAQIVITKINITWAYFDIGAFKEGESYLKYINDNTAKFGDKNNDIIVDMLNGMYAASLNKNQEAVLYFEKAIQNGLASGDKADLSYVYLEYSKYFNKRADYKNAYNFLVAYDKLEAEIVNSENIKRAKRVAVDVELDEYKRRVDSITAVNTLQQQSLKKTKVIVILFIIVMAILLLQFYTLYKNFLFKKKTNQDLTKSNEELVIAKNVADESSRLKTQFVSTITHELRTPLYGVVGITNMLLEEHKELENSPHLNSLKFSARYLLSLINDVLQINKIEENRIVLEDLTFNIGDEIGMIINSLSFIAKNHNNTIEVFIDPNIPELLIGDKLRFSQILINLLSNALKFTDNGTVTIVADLIKVEEHKQLIGFKIIDTGVGIAKEDQVKVFEKFTQLGRKELDYQGTGLGLAIVKKLLELFNSTIEVESEEGKGTTFSFVIGFEENLDKSLTIIKEIEVDTTDRQLFSILVVDDNSINRMITKKIIEKGNYQCAVVSSGEEAIELLITAKFDVILMDINMPGMDGFEATKIIRNMGIMVPIIALTAFSKEEVVEESLSSGMNDIIVKPFEAGTLFKIINQLLYKP
ncbi:hybrid sensor histidine kinase/response regulator [Flavobacterium faecale]|uniref:histidine kinase n=1 Tax=Flavobacterium faecale TaxID=1355330 RepID=A0A2S1LEW8_9FLAO|nr:response regulator [Flavobacterium faecale]AWG22277.1 hybrid sensor histidine kinase/response regulator [Flavobacterium faecale]